MGKDMSTPHQTLAYKPPVRFEKFYGQKKTQA